MLEEEQQIRFTQLWTAAQPTVSRYVASLLGDYWAVRDVIQNISLTLLRKFPEYDEARPFLPWALGIAKFEILKQKRDWARSRIINDPEFLDQYTQAWGEAAPRLEDEAAVLRTCVGELKGRSRLIVKLSYAEGRTSTFIASELGLTAANVRAILKRTRDALRRCVKKQLSFRGGSA